MSGCKAGDYPRSEGYYRYPAMTCAILGSCPSGVRHLADDGPPFSIMRTYDKGGILRWLSWGSLLKHLFGPVGGQGHDGVLRVDTQVGGNS